jgi:hypothetical protein
MSQASEKVRETCAGEKLLVQRDRRADGGSRHVQVTRGDILIARRFGGVAMMIAAPVGAYRGVGLDARADSDGDILYRLHLVHRDADLDIVLAETRDSNEAQAHWMEWSAWFDLARLAMKDDEWVALETPDAARACTRRRRSAFLAQRRPAFLSRRKTGDRNRLVKNFVDERQSAACEQERIAP